MDSAYYQADIVGALLRHKARFSITARLLPPVRHAIDAISPDAWTPIKYTNAIYDEDTQRWVSEAEVAEVEFSAFSSRPKAKQVTARLIVRRVPDINPANQSPLFAVHRHDTVFANSPLPMLQAESAHRGHAIVEQVIADLKGGPLAHLPTGSSGPAAPGWSDSDRRYLSEESMALLNPPAPTVLEPKTTATDTSPTKEIAATASSLAPAEQHATSYTTPRDATHRVDQPIHLIRPVQTRTSGCQSARPRQRAARRVLATLTHRAGDSRR